MENVERGRVYIGWENAEENTQPNARENVWPGKTRRV